jgi:hypothetical protein
MVPFFGGKIRGFTADSNVYETMFDNKVAYGAQDTQYPHEYLGGRRKRRSMRGSCLRISVKNKTFMTYL